MLYFSLFRCIYDRGDKCLKDTEDKEARVMLLESWKDFEDKNGDEERKERFEQRMPKRIKKRRKVQTEDGVMFAYYILYIIYYLHIIHDAHVCKK
jgi:hypothetical protein